MTSNTANLILNKTYDITEELIKKQPTEEDNIINDYINFIIKYNSTNNPLVRSATYSDNDKLPFNITINNNFQKYNDDNLTDNNEQFTNFYNNEILGGFKDYFPLYK